MDEIIHTEIMTDWINILLAKSIAFKDDKIMNELKTLRHKFYRENFDGEILSKKLMELSEKLKRYN